MRNIKSIVLASALFSIYPVAHAGFTINDLYLGFTKTDAASDYILDLGQAASVGVGGSKVIDLSSHFSLATFNSNFSGGAGGVVVAVVGGSTAYNANAVYATQVRTNGPSNPAIPGSLMTAGHSQSEISGGAGVLSGMVNLPSTGTSTLDSSKSYSSNVDKIDSGINFVGRTGVIPWGVLGSPSVIYLDLYKGTVATPYTYLGYFTIDLSSGTPYLNFTPSAASVGPSAPVLSIEHTGNTSTISFLSTSGVNYTLYGTNSPGLMAPVSTWPLLGTVSGDGTTKSFLDTTTDSNRFYRVKAQ